MSHSRKDGRRRGGHRDSQHTEVWSKRYPKVSMWTQASNGHRHHPSYKTLTHRHERRMARRVIREQVGEMSATESPTTRSEA